MIHRDHHVQAGARQRDDGEREHDGGKGVDGVEHEQQRIVHPARPVARQHPEHQPREEPDRHRDRRHLQRDPAPVEDPGQGVAAELVGAQQEGGRGALETVLDVDLGGAVRGQPGREDAALAKNTSTSTRPLRPERVAEEAARAREALLAARGAGAGGRRGRGVRGSCGHGGRGSRQRGPRSAR